MGEELNAKVCGPLRTDMRVELGSSLRSDIRNSARIPLLRALLVRRRGDSQDLLWSPRKGATTWELA